MPGASLYVETGSGPVLLCISGGPTDAGIFTDLAGRLADGTRSSPTTSAATPRSTLDREPEDIPVSVHADDAAAILAAVGGEPAYVYGSSGGGTIGLELVARHPDLVRTLVAHEAPVMELLPDAARWRAAFEDISDTYRVEVCFRRWGSSAPWSRRGTEVQRGDAAGTADARGREMMGRGWQGTSTCSSPTPADRRICA